MIRSHQPETLRVNPKIGDVYMIQFDGSGSVQQGYRPGVVFSNNKGNANSPTVVVFPLTTSLKKSSQPTHVILDAEECGLRYTSMVLCENPQCVPKANLGKLVAHLNDGYCAKIAEANLIASSGIAFLDIQTIISAWASAIRLNAS